MVTQEPIATQELLREILQRFAQIQSPLSGTQALLDRMLFINGTIGSLTETICRRLNLGTTSALVVADAWDHQVPEDGDVSGSFAFIHTTDPVRIAWVTWWTGPTQWGSLIQWLSFEAAAERLRDHFYTLDGLILGQFVAEMIALVETQTSPEAVQFIRDLDFVSALPCTPAGDHESAGESDFAR